MIESVLQCAVKQNNLIATTQWRFVFGKYLTSVQFHCRSHLCRRWPSPQWFHWHWSCWFSQCLVFVSVSFHGVFWNESLFLVVAVWKCATFQGDPTLHAHHDLWRQSLQWRTIWQIQIWTANTLCFLLQFYFFQEPTHQLYQFPFLVKPSYAQPT